MNLLKVSVFELLPGDVIPFNTFNYEVIDRPSLATGPSKALEYRTPVLVIEPSEDYEMEQDVSISFGHFYAPVDHTFTLFRPGQ